MVVPRRDMHVSLPTAIYARLRAESARSGQHPTVLVREAIEAWLAERDKEALHDTITGYARLAAGTPADLDPKLEGAAVDFLLDWEREDT